MRWPARDRWTLLLIIAGVSGCALLPIQRDLATIDPAAIVRGQVVSLDDPRFSPEGGVQGLWNPALFVREYGAGVYFLEPFSAAKIPVLFVHGIGGHPRGFESIIAHLKRTQFQPWIFHYPGGVRLRVTSNFLRWVLDDLHAKYHFGKVYVIAHSMGGLVSRACINEITRRESPPYVTLFVSISTPWQGHAAAALGLWFSPVVIPSWIDISPGSPFLTSVLAEPLPPTLPYYLLFAYLGSSESDGTVSLRSQLDPTAQSAAARVYGFAADHEGVLRSPALIATVNRILEAGDHPTSNELAYGSRFNDARQ